LAILITSFAISISSSIGNDIKYSRLPYPAAVICKQSRRIPGASSGFIPA
jgi:hypothetical protein